MNSLSQRAGLALACLMVWAALLGALLCWLASDAGAQGGATLEVQVPAPGEVLEAHDPITVTLILTCQDIYGYHVEVSFDPTLLSAEAAGFHDEFLRPDYRPPGWDAEIDNVAGRVRFATTQFYPAEPATGTGPIAWIRFVGGSPATLPADAGVEISEVVLATREGDRIVPTTVPGTIRVLPKAVVTGSVRLQGRSDFSGAVVSLLPAGLLQITDAGGLYTFTVPVDNYAVTVEMSRYLDAERVFALTRGDNSLPQVKLLGGDVNDDDEVDIVDMSLLGGKYGSIVDPATERTDINADGVVDIVDITIAGGNYTATSPVPW